LTAFEGIDFLPIAAQLSLQASTTTAQLLVQVRPRACHAVRARACPTPWAPLPLQTIENSAPQAPRLLEVELVDCKLPSGAALTLVSR
jgi:hypothetical protein